MRALPLVPSFALIGSGVVLGAVVGRRRVEVDHDGVRALAIARGPTTERVARAAAKVGSKKSRALASVLLACAMIERPRRSLRVLAAGIGVAALEATVKALVSRPRPGPPDRVTDTGSTAFPSGHAMTSAIGWTAASALPPAARTPARIGSIAVGLLSGLGRVALGAHWPTDLIGGALMGTGLGMAIDALLPDR